MYQNPAGPFTGSVSSKHQRQHGARGVAADAVRVSHMSGESAYRTVAWAGPPPNIPACKAHNASRTLQVHVPPTTPQSWEENVAHGVDRDAGDCPCGGGRPAASALYLLTGYTY